MTADLEGVLTLQAPLRSLGLPAGAAVSVASTDDDATLYVLAHGTGREEVVGTAPRTEIEDAVAGRTAPAPTPPPFEVPNAAVRLAAIIRNAERGSGYRKALRSLCDDLRRAGREKDAYRLELAAGRPGTSYAGGAAARLAQVRL